MPIYSTRIQHDDASYARWERAAYGDSPMSRSAYVRHDQEAEANAESWELSSARGEFPAPRAFDTSAAPRQRHMSASRNRHDAGSLAPRNARRALRWPPSVQAMGVCLLVALACTAVVALLGAALSLAASATAEMQGGELTASAPAQGEDAAPPAALLAANGAAA